MDTKASVANPALESAVPSSTLICACCRRPEEIDLLRLCCRCGQFTHEPGETECAGLCGCDMRRKPERV